MADSPFAVDPRDPLEAGHSLERVRSKDPHSLSRAFWVLSAGLFAMYLYALLDNHFSDVAWAFLISCVALFPGYLWCSGRAQGVPVLPLFAASHVWAFAFPFISNHPIVAYYDRDQLATAAATVMAFLVLATVVWYLFVGGQSKQSHHETRMAFSSAAGDGLFFAMLALSSVFTLVVYGGLLGLSASVMSSFRGVILGLGSLGIFVLAYRWGSGGLPGKHVKWFVFLLIAFMLVNGTSTLLVGSMTSFLLAVIGYSVGSRRVPWGVFALGLAIFVFLHVGKGEIRSRYLYGENDGSGKIATLSKYPAFYLEWIDDSFRIFSGKGDLRVGESLLQRASLLHILLMVQQESPDLVPYLNGETYAHIPQQLIPRIFDPDKISSHEGTVLLNLHYGLQISRDDAAVTSIGWGLLSEAYANFGNWGVAILAIFLGSLFGALSRWGMNSPVLSFRFLCNLLVLALCFNTEISAGALFASAYQSFLALVGVSFPLMKPVRVTV